MLSRFVAGIALAVLGLALLPGCGKKPARVGEPGGNATKTEPWRTAREELSKGTDVSACKTALGALNNQLASSDSPKPSEMSKEATDALAAIVPLDLQDREEIHEAIFSPHDPIYLADCLFLRDAARTLELPARPGENADQLAARNADLAFAWVCRQVYLNPFLIPVPEQPGALQATVLPPTFVLRRGYGSGLERMYVFLALLQQMGLDGCLVGPSNAANTPAGFVAMSPDNKTVLTGSPRGPFWAVGVRIGGDVRLYDPWRGEALPATLKQLKANPDAYKAWLEDPANISGLTAKEATDATAFLAVPVNSLSPRMTLLEQQVKAAVGVRLAVSPTALRDAFGDLKPAFWNPPNDRFVYGRAARTLLPTDQGGTEAGEPGSRLIDLAKGEQLLPVVSLPKELQKLGAQAEITSRIRNAIAGVYGVSFLEAPNPHERIQRGQYREAARDLVTKKDMFTQGLERIRNNRDAEQQFREWAAEAEKLYAQRTKAFENQDRAAVEDINAVIDNHWKSNGATVGLLVDRVVSPMGVAEATLLLALSKHEQAERAQAQLEAATGKDADTTGLKLDAHDAWIAAAAEWRNYSERASVQRNFPGRAAHVAALTARAQKLAAQK